MAASKAIRMALALAGLRQQDLVGKISGSKQALSGKFSRDHWTDDDLIQIADMTGCKLAFIADDGQTILIRQLDSTSED